jgi:hypothetical protein
MQVTTPFKHEHWQQDDPESLMGVVKSDLLPKSLDVFKEEEQIEIVKLFTSGMRQIKTLVGKHKQEFYDRPESFRYLLRIVTNHLLNILIPSKFQSSTLQMIFESEINKLLEEIKIGKVDLFNLHETTLYGTPPNALVTHANVALGLMDKQKNSLFDGLYDLEAEYDEVVNNGGVMLWVLSQGAFYGFARYVAIVQRMIREGKSEEDIMRVINTQIGRYGGGGD